MREDFLHLPRSPGGPQSSGITPDNYLPLRLYWPSWEIPIWWMLQPLLKMLAFKREFACTWPVKHLLRQALYGLEIIRPWPCKGKCLAYGLLQLISWPGGSCMRIWDEKTQNIPFTFIFSSFSGQYQRALTQILSLHLDLSRRELKHPDSTFVSVKARD